MSAKNVAPRFTTEVLDWSAWIAPLDLERADADQLAVLEESGPHAKASQYYRLLLRDAPALRQRSALYNAIMYGATGLRRADRELGAAIESIFNGCVYCTSVHARSYLQFAKRPEIVEALFAHGVEAALPPRETAIAEFVVALARSPPQAEARHLAALREAGLSEAETFDLLNAVGDIRLGQPVDAIAGRAQNRLWTIAECPNPKPPPRPKRSAF